ncbi:hypothetical protein PG1C_13890 [Rugosibacter aromaticivorans]|uniref:Uncharacterized protein n=1 Tax=Rugosibacter aromaticivorans TaxID=1565605 RepID=A0A0C5JBU8_9PROT|nr:hypothetical protein PG1C_13890 [Rugosibacter aromaticivorans]
MQTCSPSVRYPTKWFYSLLLRPLHNLTRLSRNALVTTDTKLSAMAARAATGIPSGDAERVVAKCESAVLADVAHRRARQHSVTP